MDADLEVRPESVPLDTSASAIVVEQLARIAVQPEKAKAVPHIVDRLAPMIDGLVAHLTPTHAKDERPSGMLLDGCFNQPREFANRSELVWGSAYLLYALYYLRTQRCPR